MIFTNVPFIYLHSSKTNLYYNRSLPTKKKKKQFKFFCPKRLVISFFDAFPFPFDTFKIISVEISDFFQNLQQVLWTNEIDTTILSFFEKTQKAK